MRSWKGVTAIGLLQKCLHQTRPYEKKKMFLTRSTPCTLQRLTTLCAALMGLDAVLKKARVDFENIPETGTKNLSSAS